MSARITIDHNTAEVGDELLALAERIDSLRPIMGPISEILVDEAQGAFSQQADPSTGAPWLPLAPSTIEDRERHGYWPGSILQRQGRLAASISGDFGDDFAAAGTNVVYAAVMHFGADRGEFGATRYGVPVPWGDIAGRPILGLSEAGGEEILDLVRARALGD